MEKFLTSHGRQNGLAPLYGADSSDAISNEYVVSFWPEHTLAQHFRAIGVDLSSTLGFAELGDAGYYATVDDEVLLGCIRADPGVVFVGANRMVYLIDSG